MPEEEKVKTLLDHLEELRRRILLCLLTLALLFPPAWMASQWTIEWMKDALCPSELGSLYYMAPLELFFLRMKVSLGMAVFAGLPILAWNVWRFVSPGLFKSERRAAVLLSLSSAALFLCGAAFALSVIFPMLMGYAVSLGTPDVRPMMNVSEFVWTAWILMIGFGICFQLPIAVFVLAWTGITSVQTMSKARPYFIIGIFIVAGLLTPPDVISQVAMAAPTWALFEMSLLAARLVERKREDSKPDE